MGSYMYWVKLDFAIGFIVLFIFTAVDRSTSKPTWGKSECITLTIMQGVFITFLASLYYNATGAIFNLTGLGVLTIVAVESWLA